MSPNEGGEAWLVNANIPEYAAGNRFNHEPRRPRKLLLHRAQINKLIGAIQREGRTVVPLQVYFNPKGRAKIEIALATGKKAHDKRALDQGARLAAPAQPPAGAPTSGRDAHRPDHRRRARPRPRLHPAVRRQRAGMPARETRALKAIKGDISPQARSHRLCRGEGAGQDARGRGDRRADLQCRHRRPRGDAGLDRSRGVAPDLRGQRAGAADDGRSLRRACRALAAAQADRDLEHPRQHRPQQRRPLRLSRQQDGPQHGMEGAASPRISRARA